jgi:phosphoribosylformimino-5-aminoimidazole carboxamide ribonucleotide (ProFAR) isomerase
MILIPVLHLKDGQAVYNDAKGVINRTNPLELTERWFSSGIEWIQVNDLNVSVTVQNANEEIVKKIAQSKLKVQVFGNFKSIN